MCGGNKIHTLFSPAAPTLTAGFVQTVVGQTEGDRLTSARLRAFVNGRITQPVELAVSITGGTATGITKMKPFLL